MTGLRGPLCTTLHFRPRPTNAYACGRKQRRPLAANLYEVSPISFQVVDFLSGKAPLNLTMRLGDHMMLIQLQLSTVNSSSSKRSRGSAAAAAAVAAAAAAATTASQTLSASSRSSLSGSSSVATSPTSSSSSSASSSPKSSPSSATATSSPPCYKPKLDTRALAEASKNLTQTLKQLSSEVLTTKTAAASSSSTTSGTRRPAPASDEVREP